MEKRTPHYQLAKVQALVASTGSRAFTLAALRGGRAMGLTTDEMLDLVCGLANRNFYKSMTTYRDHRVWQDVYHAPVGPRIAYIKITLTASAPVIQFKEI